MGEHLHFWLDCIDLFIGILSHWPCLGRWWLHTLRREIGFLHYMVGEKETIFSSPPLWLQCGRYHQYQYQWRIVSRDTIIASWPPNFGNITITFFHNYWLFSICGFIPHGLSVLLLGGCYKFIVAELGQGSTSMSMEEGGWLSIKTTHVLNKRDGHPSARFTNMSDLQTCPVHKRRVIKLDGLQKLLIYRSWKLGETFFIQSFSIL